MRSLCVFSLLAATTLAPAAHGADSASDGSAAWLRTSLRPPHPPALVAFTDAGGHVSLNWENVSTAEGFRILRSSNGKDFSPIDEVKGTHALSFTDMDPNRGRTRFYRLEAYNAAGTTESNTAVVHLPAFRFPAIQPVPPAAKGNSGTLIRPNQVKPRIPRLGGSTLRKRSSRR